MKVRVIFTDWQECTNKGIKSIYSTPKGNELSMGSLHSGSTWNGEIEFDEDTAAEMKSKGKYMAIFEIEPIDDNNNNNIEPDWETCKGCEWLHQEIGCMVGEAGCVQEYPNSCQTHQKKENK